MQRVMIFIDGSNFFHGVTGGLKQDFYKVDIDKFIEKIVANRELMRIYYYTVRPTDSSIKSYNQQLSFLDRLERKPYFKLRLGRLAGPKGNQREKGADIFLALDMLLLAQNDTYDVAALISGDGDFSEVINRVQEIGKIVENYAFKGKKSDHLLRTCDVFHYIDDNYFT
ncbi:MAG: NYN domain-containing protein [Deltaproteobacteria bacterium]|nr:NYN domain-containing protein [Deltaproteobacteria bacterium]MBW2085947.1 NYN domain-containing protein [Deltaproteobacteria bacterium]